MQGDWNAKIGEDASKNWKRTCGQYCNPETNGRGLRLLEFASFNNLKVVNTSGSHKPSRRWKRHCPGGDHHNQIDHIMVKRRFQSSQKLGAGIRSDHELVMMTFRLCLQRIKKKNQTNKTRRKKQKTKQNKKNNNEKKTTTKNKKQKQGNVGIGFRLEKLKDPRIAEIVRAAIGRRGGGGGGGRLSTGPPRLC